ncbi:hypothetical protein NIES4071_86990 [Calothrix sp. NIES-4071]|nr:hypothetical protein NIES4071_86990 [Calothrix sp. NIES-4071]BAZ62966.1 hypothetical protein NIES4105_86920 [Calothrix sp. NIES-4105]
MVSLNPLTNPSTENPKFTYNVLLAQEQDARFSAVVIGLSDLKSLGKTEEEALENLQQLLQERLKNSKIITLKTDCIQAENPWTKVIGMYKDNPLFDEVLSEIEAERCKLYNSFI